MRIWEARSQPSLGEEEEEVMSPERLARCLEIAQILQSGRTFTVAEFIKVAGVSRRTIFRDLHTLSQAGLVHRYDPGKRKYFVSKAACLPSVESRRRAATGQILVTGVLAKMGELPENWVSLAATRRRSQGEPIPGQDDPQRIQQPGLHVLASPATRRE